MERVYTDNPIAFITEIKFCPNPRAKLVIHKWKYGQVDMYLEITSKNGKNCRAYYGEDILPFGELCETMEQKCRLTEFVTYAELCKGKLWDELGEREKDYIMKPGNIVHNYIF